MAVNTPEQARRMRWVGIGFIVLGVIAILLPELATLAVEAFIAWGFVIWGVLGVSFGLSLRHRRGGWQLTAIFAMVALLGLILAFKPIVGILTLTMVLIALLIVEGLFSLVLGFELRGQHPGWGWAVLSGVISLLFAALVISGWPGTAAWLLGLLAGFNFLSTGLSALALSRMIKP